MPKATSATRKSSEVKEEVMEKPMTTPATSTSVKKAALLGAGAVLAAILVIGGVAMAVSHFNTRLAGNNYGYGRGGMNGDGFGGHMGFAGMRPIFGLVTKIDGNTVTITTSASNTDTVKISDTTRLTQNRQQAALSDIKTGDQLVVFGTLSGSTITATRIAINPGQ